MNVNDIAPGMKVTVLYRGVPFANSIVINSRMMYGSLKFFLKGNVDDDGYPIPVSAQDLRPWTKGWYDSNPNKQNGIEKR
jgi:hypothetical protein